MRDQVLAVIADRRRALHNYGPVLRAVFTASTHNPRFLAEYRATMIEPSRAAISSKAAELDEAFGVREADATRDARVRALMALVVGFFVSTLLLADEPDAAVADALLRVMGWDEAV